MPDVVLIVLAYFVGLPVVVFASAYALDRLGARRARRRRDADLAAIEAYANDPAHAAHAAVREALARRNARTQTLVQGVQRNAPALVDQPGARDTRRSTSCPEQP